MANFLKEENELHGVEEDEYENFLYEPQPLSQRPRTNICNLVMQLPQTLLQLLTASVIRMESGRQLQVLELIAEGGFSYVYQAKDTRTKKIYALKKVLIQTSAQEHAIQQEIRYHQMFQHPCLLRLLDQAIVKNPQSKDYYLLFPYYQQGSLRHYIDARSLAIPEPEILSIFLQVCEALAVLHEHEPPYAHRDLKPENILLGCRNTPVVIDLGSVTQSRVMINTRLEALQLQELAAQNSSMPYRAPELFDTPTHYQVTESTDIWSLGCLVFAMAFGYSPFECTFNAAGEIRIVECTYLAVIGKWKFPPRTRISNDLCDLIRWMLTIDAANRPSIRQVIDRLIRIKQTQLKR